MACTVELRSGPNGTVLNVPAGSGRRPGILFLHGSEGRFAGWSPCQALAFAHQGFVTLAFGYGKNGNAWHAGDIHEVDLDDTAQALQGLRAHDAVSGKVGLFGASRGGEHALLLTSLMARDRVAGLPDAVAAHSPSDTIVGAFIAGSFSPKEREVWDPSKRAWRWRGSSEGLLPTTPIEIERYEGPIFLSHGEADSVWTVECTRRLETRLTRAGRSPEVHYYPEQDHRLTPEAQNLQYARLVSFFRRYLEG
jgi:dipeptidyl aminopeptidase/acylaminoacyl peptidase